mgnify:CR=1 FL=1
MPSTIKPNRRHKMNFFLDRSIAEIRNDPICLGARNTFRAIDIFIERYVCTGQQQELLMQNYVKQINENSIAVVMNPESNPLNGLPRVQRFQIMAILSIMWTTIFSTALGSWFYYGELVVGHLAVLLGIFITAGVFKSSQQPLKSYRDYPREDGTARYDDVWGG